MATANFRPMEYNMPLVCGNLTDYDEMAEAYEKETGEEYNEFLFEFDQADEWERAKSLAEDFTYDLTFHDVTIESGYYGGFQFYVEERYSNIFDLDKDSRYCITNEDAHEYFDMCRSKAIRAADAEKRKIAKWLEKLTEHGFKVLIVTARFSNGETHYAERTPRAQLLAAVRA